MRESTSTNTSDNPDNDDYIVTSATHNYISRTAVQLMGSHQIELLGRSVVRPGVTIRGDLAWVRIGRFCTLQDQCVVEPPPAALSSVGVPTTAIGVEPTSTTTITTSSSILDRNNPTKQQYIPVSIGSYTTLGRHVHSQAAAIGSFCWIGHGVFLGPRVIVKDGCVIADGVVLAADTTVPPWTRVFLLPNTADTHDDTRTTTTATANNKNNSNNWEWKELPPSIAVELQERAVQRYQKQVAAAAAEQTRRKLSAR
jgi:dynactin 5